MEPFTRCNNLERPKWNSPRSFKRRILEIHKTKPMSRKKPTTKNWIKDTILMATSATSTTSTDKSLVSQKFALYNRAKGAHPFLFFFRVLVSWKPKYVKTTKTKCLMKTKTIIQRRRKKCWQGKISPSLPFQHFNCTYRCFERYINKKFNYSHWSGELSALLILVPVTFSAIWFNIKHNHHHEQVTCFQEKCKIKGANTLSKESPLI